MKRRNFVKTVSAELVLAGAAGAMLPPRGAAAGVPARRFIETAQGRDWLARWEKRILSASGSRYCDKETGEELGWLVSPFLDGFHHGHLATGDVKWVEMLVDWADACFRRAVEEPDGFPGWPKGDGGGGGSEEYAADSLLGEAMMLRPIVLMADRIRTDPGLRERFGDQARRHLELAARIFEKWDSRACWREVKDGGVWVVPAFGIDRKTGRWSAGYADRETTGFTNPDNKQNHIARWMLAMHAVTGQPVYRERAEKWFGVMKARLKTREGCKFAVWNYWEPAGRWDYKPDGSPKHWVGVHPNGGYYAIDVGGMVEAYEHGLVFVAEDLKLLVATNRDFMWNQSLEEPRFQRIDGGVPDERWKNTPGVLWDALVPYDDMLRKIFLASHDPASWGGLGATPWFLAAGGPRDL